MYKPLSDSTLMKMTKKDIIEHLRVAEHNLRVCEETIDQQYKNCMELLKKERTDAIDEVIRLIKSKHATINYSEQTDIHTTTIYQRDTKWLKEQLKENTNE